MSTFKDHFYFGTIGRAHGLKGEMVVKNLVEEADLLSEFDTLFLDVNHQLTPFFLRKISFRKKGEAIIEIEDINSIEATKQLEKKDIYLPETLLPEEDDDFIKFKDLIGYAVSDENFGPIGKIKNVLPYPQQEIFEIEFNGREILIPANEDFIVEIDVEHKHLKLSVPEGLIELYLTDKHKQDE